MFHIGFFFFFFFRRFITKIHGTECEFQYIGQLQRQVYTVSSFLWGGRIVHSTKTESHDSARSPCTACVLMSETNDKINKTEQRPLPQLPSSFPSPTWDLPSQAGGGAGQPVSGTDQVRGSADPETESALRWPRNVLWINHFVLSWDTHRGGGKEKGATRTAGGGPDSHGMFKIQLVRWGHGLQTTCSQYI